MFGSRKKKTTGRLGPIQSFLIYYGHANEDARRRLMEAELAVIELQQWQPYDVADLRASGTAVYGYLSVMESPEWNRKRSAAIEPADIFMENGKPVRFEQWNSVLMDLRSPGYRRLLLAELDEIAASYRLDGIFLDTVGDIEDYVPLPLQEEMTAAYRTFLAVASGRHKQMKWLQNRGFRQLDSCAALLDGFLWEGFEAGTQAIGWSGHWINALARHRKAGLSVLSVSDRDDPRIAQEARKNGFLHWTSPAGGYNSL
ncbi:endo alpha-1,4 polygalactosaminidase [Paenibacillus sp. N4]|uniref:endo alpha-1,4 polygalactosaminidase n=1 Tax=Paenibacillus vietnamensis TaxID=2590547 RepID=UPI001CD0AEE4|nr:endo alpha-1,4 polygalactosaminidase [Paenibacillus vietnamensis]MCA0756661.1 endo alpha-1,4 polygalactosaminidase [Paenibacillus vietnamensis]